MLERVHNETRLIISSGFQLAFRGEVESALSSFDTFLLRDNTCNIDIAAVSLAKAELLFLDGKFLAALEEFENRLDGLVEKLPDDLRIPVVSNRSDVVFRRLDFGGIGGHYLLADQKRIAGIEYSNDSEVLYAYRQSIAGKSYNSLPVFWKELKRTYQQKQWREFRKACEYMSDQCIRIGELPEAAYHAAISCSSDAANVLVTTLLNSRDHSTVKDIVLTLVAKANLQAHFAIACEILKKISDLVPDENVDLIATWVLKRCKITKSEDHDSMARTAWTTIAAFGSRISEPVAIKILSVALAHPAWKLSTENPNQIPRIRQEILETVGALLPVIPPASFSDLASQTLPLAKERRSFSDFTTVVNLLAHIVHLSKDEELRASIRQELYPKGERMPPVLMQVASHFGVEIQNTSGQLDKYVDSIVEMLEKVVQRVPKGEQPESVGGTVMTHCSEGEAEDLHVHNINTGTIHSVIRNKEKFSHDLRARVVRALLKGISDDDNSPENKISFIECIRGFAECMTADLANDVFDAFEPIIKQEVDSSKFSSAVHHPLSSFRFSGTTFEQFVGHALFVLAVIERKTEGVFGKRLSDVVEISLSSEWPVVRESAFAAVREIPTISDSLWMPLLLGTRDTDPKAALLAFDAISNKEDRKLKRPHWPILIYSLKLAQRHNSIQLRSAAAKAVRILLNENTSRKNKTELETLIGQFSNDIAFSVRQAARNES